MVLIFYALRREIGGVRKRIKNRCALGEGLRGFRGRIGGEEIALVATGIGAAQARESARRALETLPRPRLVISTGVAGALAPDLKAGDLIIADGLILEVDQPDQNDRTAQEPISVSPDGVRLAQQALERAGLRFATGPLLTAGRVLATPNDKRAAHRQTGAIAVDMESAVIALAAAAVSAPFISVRAVLDEADHEVPGADLPDAAGHVAPLKAAAFFLGNPAALARVPALLRNLNRATNSLAAALEALCVDSRF
jgi:adenosylhomocysteine nucleosidase